MIRTVRHFWPDFNRWLNDLPDTRSPRLVIYDKRFLAWWGILLFALRLGSRRRLDAEMRDLESSVLVNVNRLAGTQQDSLPVHGTLEHFLGHVGAQPFADLRTEMVGRLVRMKVLDYGRVQGRLVVAVDGTGWLTFATRHCPHCLTQTQGATTIYYHPVLEGKVVDSRGLAISIATTFIENADAADVPADAGAERRKQDCELKAFARLAPDLKKNFPQLRICLSGDAQFACGTGFKLAKDNGFDFIYVFKEGRTPALWREFQDLQALSPENALHARASDGVERTYRWVNGLTHVDDEKRTHDALNAIECKETAKGKTTTFAWITGLPVSAKNVVEVADQGGRVRWKIENQGFNTQKNGDYNLEHAYSKDPECLKAYYYLLQIAHMVMQLVEKGSLLRHIAEERGKKPMALLGSLKNLARRILEGLRNRLLPEDAFSIATCGGFQIRIDTT